MERGASLLGKATFVMDRGAFFIDILGVRALRAIPDEPQGFEFSSIRLHEELRCPVKMLLNKIRRTPYGSLYYRYLYFETGNLDFFK